ncbi:MAG: hypothetical protein HYZ53_29550 [Planctomycetes bacterium]|nr:hypothetical protein [Planctomycetota bacterium]
MQGVIGGPAATWLAARREELNARFQRALWRFPRLEAERVLALLAELLPPLAGAEERAGEKKERGAGASGPGPGAGTEALLSAVYDLVLLHAGRQTLAPRSGAEAAGGSVGGGTSPALGLLFREVFPAIRSRLLERPLELPAALSNAVENLGERGPAFARGIARVAACAPGADALLDAGAVLAWRLGEARLRRAALAAAARLPARAALEALGLGDWPDAAAPLALASLAADGWRHPRDVFSPRTVERLPKCSHEELTALGARLAPDADAPLEAWAPVGKAGEFSGFGGEFAEPPLLLEAGAESDRHRFWASAGEARFRIDADCFGCVCRADPAAAFPVRRVTAPAGSTVRPKRGAASRLAAGLAAVASAVTGAKADAPPAEPLLRVSADGTVTREGESRAFPLLVGATSFVSLDRALAVALADSHRIRILAPVRPAL